MKIRKIIWLLPILAVLIFFAGCKDKVDDDGYNLSLIEAMPASSVQKFSGTAVANSTEAEDLFEDMWHTDFFDMLLEADRQAFSDAFKIAYGKADVKKYSESIVAEDPAATSLSYYVDINDTTRYKAKSGANAATITGAESYSFDSNLAMKKFVEALEASLGAYDVLKEKEDNYALTISGNRTCEISKGFYEDTGFKIAGFVIVEYNASMAASLVDKDKDMCSLDQNIISKASMTLSVSNGTKGAKFRFSGVCVIGIDLVMPRDMSYNTIFSDLEVYNNNDVLLFTIDKDMDFIISIILEIAESFMVNNNGADSMLGLS